MTIEEMRGYLGVTRKKFSEMYEIPVRTLENWESGVRKAPEYVTKLLERVVMEDKKMVCKEIMENALGLVEFGNIPEVEVGEEYKLLDIWDGEGETPCECNKAGSEGSYSYLLTNNGEDGESNVDVYVNYSFVVTDAADDPAEVYVKVTNIELI